MKSSLILKKDLVENRFYWCVQNNHRVLNLLKYTGHDLFEGSHSGKVRIMFEGYVNTNKAQIPKRCLVSSRYYWCKFKNEENLYSMRYEGENENLFYSPSDDVFWDSKDVTAVFEDYES